VGQRTFAGSWHSIHHQQAFSLCGGLRAWPVDEIKGDETRTNNAGVIAKNGRTDRYVVPALDG
jgi:hypothetical protein